MFGFLKEADGQVSGRRVAAFVCLLASIALTAFAIATKADTWYPYAGAGGFLAAMLFLFFFTTWGDIADAATKIRGRE